MHEICHDKSCLNLYARIRNAGFTDETVGKICVQGYINEEEQVTALLEDLESNFKMHQYKEDNGIAFNTEDLFYWGDRERYFDVTIKADTKENHDIIATKVIEIITSKFSNTNFYVRLQYENRINWQRAEEFMQQDFEIDNLPIKELGAIYSEIQYGHGKLSKSASIKLYELSDSFRSQYIDKKVLVNGDIKGTVKKLKNGYGLFKPRATRTYYHFNLDFVQSIKLI